MESPANFSLGMTSQWCQHRVCLPLCCEWHCNTTYSIGAYFYQRGKTGQFWKLEVQWW